MTTAYALVAPLRLGEDAKRFVRSLGIGRADLKVGRREGHILIPLQRVIDPPFAETSVEIAEFNSTKPPRSYRDGIQIPERFRDQLPSSFDVVGDLAIIKVPDAIRVYGPAIAEAILKVHKNVKGVFHDEGVHGPFRIRRLVPLAGVDRTKTVHTEFTARLIVDVAKAYFSPRLANEHDRLAKAVGLGEIVADLTAGVGPFAILIARQRRAAKVYAMDLNPDAVTLLGENVASHRLADKVVILAGDAATEVAKLEPLDRVIVNLPHGGEEILFAAARRLKPGGRLHYYRIVSDADRAAYVERLQAAILAQTGRNATMERSEVVHAYSAADRLFALDLRVA